MSRQYDVTYHQNGKTHTMHLSQEELDNLLAFGDTYPLKSADEVTLKCEWKAHSSDRLWWGNNPLDVDLGSQLLLAGLVYVTSINSR